MDRLQCIRESLDITNEAMRAFAEAAKPGASEHALEAALRSRLRGHPAKWDLLTGERTALIQGQATDRLLRVGDPMILDLSVQTDGQWTDVCRTFFLGTMDAEMADVYDMAVEAMALNAAALRPGAEAGALYALVRDAYARRGRGDMLKHHTGHAVAATPFEPPVERAGNADRVRAGDVMTVEIGAYQGGQWGVRLESLYLVEADGARLLWEEPLDKADAVIRIEG